MPSTKESKTQPKLSPRAQRLQDLMQKDFAKAIEAQQQKEIEEGKRNGYKGGPPAKDTLFD